MPRPAAGLRPRLGLCLGLGAELRLGGRLHGRGHAASLLVQGPQLRLHGLAAVARGGVAGRGGLGGVVPWVF